MVSQIGPNGPPVIVTGRLDQSATHTKTTTVCGDRHRKNGQLLKYNRRTVLLYRICCLQLYWSVQWPTEALGYQRYRRKGDMDVHNMVSLSAGLPRKVPQPLSKSTDNLPLFHNISNTKMDDNDYGCAILEGKLI